MVKVAVAGGAGKLGLHIVEALAASPKHTVVVLARASSEPNPTLTALGIEVRPVDYGSHESIVAALDGVHTVISTISGHDRATIVDAQIALVRAAAAAPSVKRFAPSEFAVRALKDDIMRYFALKTLVIDALKETSLEWTIFENGLFMNYLATGTKGLGYLGPLKPGIDVDGCEASVPGDGTARIVLTCAEDIGAFVTASLALETWPEVLGMKGEAIAFNDLIKAAEEVRGKKFDVKYTPVETIRESMNPNPTHLFENFLQEYNIVIAEGIRFASFDANLNSLCPEVKPMGVKEFLEKWWSKV